MKTNLVYGENKPYLFNSTFKNRCRIDKDWNEKVKLKNLIEENIEEFLCKLGVEINYLNKSLKCYTEVYEFVYIEIKNLLQWRTL